VQQTARLTLLRCRKERIIRTAQPNLLHRTRERCGLICGWRCRFGLGRRKTRPRRRAPERHPKRSFATKILEDILESSDKLDFADEKALKEDISKRMRTTHLMDKSQDLYGKAFEYPNDPDAKKCLPNNEKGERTNPRVNKAADEGSH
jgi:hypothetical protein